MKNAFIRLAAEGEEGHATPFAGTMVGAAGAIILAIGAAGDSGLFAIIGGIVLAIGIVVTFLLNHSTVDYDIYRRLEELEKK